MQVPKKAFEKFEALMHELKATHAGQYLLYNIDDGTYPVAHISMNLMPVHDAYDKKYGKITAEHEPPWRNMLGNIIP
jgi:hypothetical protein